MARITGITSVATHSRVTPERSHGGTGALERIAGPEKPTSVVTGQSLFGYLGDDGSCSGSAPSLAVFPTTSSAESSRNAVPPQL